MNYKKTFTDVCTCAPTHTEGNSRTGVIRKVCNYLLQYHKCYFTLKKMMNKLTQRYGAKIMKNRSETITYPDKDNCEIDSSGGMK